MATMTVQATESNLNKDQKAVFDRLARGENIFITGNAGTGKSFLVKAFDEWCTNNKKNLVKTAPTGVAAMEIGGATLHSQFKLKLGLDFEPPVKYPKWLDETDILLIDEISMLRIDVFDKLMGILLLANNARSGKKKSKPIQMVFCGDFYQLAPVINKDERPLIDEHYKTKIGDGYPFQSKFWRMFDVKLCNLTTVIRQQDAQFCHALDQCKAGDPSFIRYIQSVSTPYEMNDAIWVCGKNATVKARNDMGLARLSGAKYKSNAEYKNKVTKKDGLCDEIFEYKIGAKVVMLRNDPEGNYQNGSMGIITESRGDKILVRILKNDEIVAVEKAEFPKYEYKTGMVDEKDLNGNLTGKKRKKLIQSKIGAAYQYPMKLGYAVTIHKSQGQTYDAMNFDPEIFATGQLYVALSRCKTAENIYLSKPLYPYMVKTSPEVLQFYSDPENYHFFEEEDERISLSVDVPKKYAKRLEAEVKKLIVQWESEEHHAKRQEQEQTARSWGNQTDYRYSDTHKPNNYQNDFSNAIREETKTESLKDGYQFSLFDTPTAESKNSSYGVPVSDDELPF